MPFPKPLYVAPHPAESDCGRAKLLVLDDDHVGRLKLLGQLQDHGTCIECENPFQALARVRENRFDVAIVACDLPLSSMSGQEFVEQLHAIDSTISVILLADCDQVISAIQSSVGAILVLPKNGTPGATMRGAATAAIRQTATNRQLPSTGAELNS